MPGSPTSVHELLDSTEQAYRIQSLL